MGFFESFTKTIGNIAAAPVSIAADALTLGGVLTDRNESYTEERVRKLAKNAKNTLNHVEKILD